MFVENLRYAADALAKHRIKLLIEPINTRDIPGFFLTGTEQAIQIISEVGSENLFVQYDIYHMQIMEGDLAPTMKKHLGRIAHIQWPDNPAATRPAPVKSTIPSCFAIWTRSGIVAGSAVNTSRRPQPLKVLGGTNRIRSMRN